MLNTTNKHQPSSHSLPHPISSTDKQEGKKAATSTTGKCGYSLQLFVYICIYYDILLLLPHSSGLGKQRNQFMSQYQSAYFAYELTKRLLCTIQRSLLPYWPMPKSISIPISFTQSFSLLSHRYQKVLFLPMRLA